MKTTRAGIWQFKAKSKAAADRAEKIAAEIQKAIKPPKTKDTSKHGRICRNINREWTLGWYASNQPSSYKQIKGASIEALKISAKKIGLTHIYLRNGNELLELEGSSRKTDGFISKR